MVGGVVHTLYGALGVGAARCSSLPVLFNPLLIAGAAYMAWIGLIARPQLDHRRRRSGRPAAARSGRAFRQGAVTCLINPKAYLFMLAVYPQFLKPDYGPIWIQAVVMAIMTIATQFGIYGGLAFAAGESRDLLLDHPARDDDRRAGGGMAAHRRGGARGMACVAGVARWRRPSWRPSSLPRPPATRRKAASTVMAVLVAGAHAFRLQKHLALITAPRLDGRTSPAMAAQQPCM